MDVQPELRIGDWWVVWQLNELHNGPRQVRIEARSMDVLDCLVRHAGEVVTKEQILDEVWGNAHVSEGVISHAISELRRVFADDPKKSRYIQTAHRRGYRLVAPIHRAQGAAEPRLGVVVGQGYRLTERLGHGAMGIVFKALDETLQREVALKFLTPELSQDPTARTRFLREARLAARLDHPNLATVHEVGETPGGRLFIVTPFYGGGTLRDRLLDGPVSIDLALEWIHDLAEGLGVAHQSGIVHRDVKPSNILFAEDGRLKLADFGIAKLGGSTRLTSTGASLGTPSYKSPEQSRGEEVDSRADIWSLGAVLYEMLTGRAPFQGDNELAILHAILEDDPLPLERADTAIPKSLSHLVHRALEKDPEDRFPSTRDFIDAVATCRGELSNPPEADHGRSNEPEPRRLGFPAAWILAALTMAMLAIVGFWSLGPMIDSAKSSRKVLALIDQGMRLEDEGDHWDNLEAAIKKYEQALELEPDNPIIRSHLALALSRLEQQDSDPARRQRIEELVSTATASSPALWLASWAQSKLYFLNHEWRDAETSARNALEQADRHHPWADSPRILIGYALNEQGFAERAVSVLEEGLDRSTGIGYVRIRSALANLLGFELNQYEKAVPLYLEILEVDHENFDAHHNLGTLYTEMGRHRDALRELQAALDIAPHAHTANNLGKVFFSLARLENRADYWQKAIESFELAITLDESYATPHLGLGDTYLYGPMADQQYALECYRSALRLLELEIAQAKGKPNNRILAQRALCYAKLERFEEAIQQLETLLDGSNQVDLHASMVYALAGDRVRLYGHLRAAIETSRSADLLIANPELDAYREEPEFRSLVDGDLSILTGGH